MLVTSAIAGDSLRNERSLSSASTTMYSPFPSLALLPNALSRPPITAVGSMPARSILSATIEVVRVHGRRRHDHVDRADVGGGVARRNANAQRAQAIGHL